MVLGTVVVLVVAMVAVAVVVVVATTTLMMVMTMAVVVVMVSSASSSRLAGNEVDRLSLLAFKAEIVTDTLGILSPWNESLHFCHWPGITCGHRHQRVTVLDLQSSRLAGHLSPHIGNLSFLRALYLQNNSFSHTIPPEIGRLFRLEELFLDNNSFGGHIPFNISRCSNLQYLRLNGNTLSDELPTEIASLSKLQCCNLCFLADQEKQENLSQLEDLGVSLLKLSYGDLNKTILNQHRKLPTACSSIDFHGNEFKALVNWFKVKGSLEEWLNRSIQRVNMSTNLQKHSDLIQRVNIAIDLGSARDYLHNRSHRPITD
ncbi:putative receptor-like protein kinase At3g47110 [Malus domestica]|uniref:putative receptor-like protein kinase At3g47110 n=1 Tax=Malus domestica TaxID=3750 RepID=UPI0039748A9E